MQNLTNRTKQTLPSTLILSAATYAQAQMHFFGTPEEWNAEWSELTHELTQFEHYAQTQKAQRGFKAWLAEAEANSNYISISPNGSSQYSFNFSAS